MRWQPLRQFCDPSVPKLNNLRRAAAAGLRVPPTWWARAANAPLSPPTDVGPGPLIIRSGSPTEDTRETSNAGQLLSLVVRERAEFAEAVRRVVAALPRDGGGAPLGAVFVQPLVNAVEAGVAFFDGFYYERTAAAGGNEALTSGQARGEVRRGHLQRGEEWSEWLARVYAVFADDGRIDVEFARDATGLVLLQARPALFPVARNHTLTVANHKETLGDLPSPWISSTFVEAGQDLSFLTQAEPAIAGWEEAYAVEAAGRMWMNVSLWLRWMDHFGLPRSFVGDGIGGLDTTPEDRRLILGRFVRNVPRLVWFQLLCRRKMRQAERRFEEIDAALADASGLADLARVTVGAGVVALHSNFAINAVWSGVVRLRRFLRLPGAARVVTHDMMEEYGRLAALPDAASREAGLDSWLARYGHRGPMESDPARPRFAELRDVLLRDLLASPVAAPPEPPAPGVLRRLGRWLLKPFYRIDERREWFRDQMMRRWQRLRARMLEEGTRLAAAGEIDAAEDVFWLRTDDLRQGMKLREAVARNRAAAERVRDLDLPLTGSREAIEELARRSAAAPAVAGEQHVFPGIALGPAGVEGRAVRAADLADLLADGGGLAPDAILVVPALEPSWAVVFPRVAGVVAEVGGELSHASILLREARKPAVVNCLGIFRRVRSGDRLRLDGERGLVEVLGPSG